MKLYKSLAHPGYWVACISCISGTGWVAFPARANGWEERQPARGLDPLHLREVPLRLAANTGMPIAELAEVA